MALRNLELVPKGLFVEIKGVPFPVRPSIELLGARMADSPRLANKEGLRQLYTSNILKIYNELKKGQEDKYFKLIKEQPLVMAGAIKEDDMYEIFTNFKNEILRKYTVWADLLHWQPEKIGFKMPEGHSYNAALIQNWYLPESGGIENIDVSNAAFTPVNWIETNGKITEKMTKQLDLPKDLQNVSVLANKKESISDYGGYDALLLGCWLDKEEPDLISSRDPLEWGSDGGSLLGSKMTFYEMMRKF